MTRLDVVSVLQRDAWAGFGSLPFGLIGCDGWLRPCLRLSDRVASEARHGSSTSIVSVRPNTSSESACLVNVRGDVRSDVYSFALSRLSRRCSRTCQSCGKPGSHVRGFGVYCRSHAPSSISVEILSDARSIRRERRKWVIAAEASWPTSFATVGAMRLPIYEIDGSSVIRTFDATPGSRAQLFDSLIDDGLIPIEVAGKWVFEFKRSTIVDWKN